MRPWMEVGEAAAVIGQVRSGIVHVVHHGLGERCAIGDSRLGRGSQAGGQALPAPAGRSYSTVPLSSYLIVRSSATMCRPMRCSLISRTPSELQQDSLKSGSYSKLKDVRYSQVKHAVPCREDADGAPAHPFRDCASSRATSVSSWRSPIPFYFAGARIRMYERLGRSIHARSTSVRPHRGVAIVISSSPWRVLPQSRVSTRSTRSRPLGSCAMAEVPRPRASASKNPPLIL